MEKHIFFCISGSKVNIVLPAAQEAVQCAHVEFSHSFLVLSSMEVFHKVLALAGGRAQGSALTPVLGLEVAAACHAVVEKPIPLQEDSFECLCSTRSHQLLQQSWPLWAQC